MKVSVVIPAYNAVAFLPRCLNSVFAQTLKPEEVIVVDDNSTDTTASLAEELGAKVVRRKVNGGLSAARNSGIQNATSEWIALLDADDLWLPEKLERQAAQVRPDVVLIYTGIRYFDDNGIRSVVPAINPTPALKMLRYCNPIPCTYLVRRDALMHDGGYREDIRACEDWEMLVRLQHLGKFEALTEPLVDIYLHPGSLSANPGRMILALNQIIDTTLVADLYGFDRWAWRRRIRAVQLWSAALIARDNRLQGEALYMFRSLCSWPSPFWKPSRFAAFALSAKNEFFRRDKVQ